MMATSRKRQTRARTLPNPKSKSPVGFFDLPPELRFMIYKFYGENNCLHGEVSFPRPPKLRSRWQHAKVQKNSLSLLRTSHRMFADSAHFYYWNVSLLFENFATAATTLKKMGNTAYYLRSISIRFCSSWSTVVLERFALMAVVDIVNQLAADGSLETLKIIHAGVDTPVNESCKCFYNDLHVLLESRTAPLMRLRGLKEFIIFDKDYVQRLQTGLNAKKTKWSRLHDFYSSKREVRKSIEALQVILKYAVTPLPVPLSRWPRNAILDGPMTAKLAHEVIKGPRCDISLAWRRCSTLEGEQKQARSWGRAHGFKNTKFLYTRGQVWRYLTRKKAKDQT